MRIRSLLLALGLGFSFCVSAVEPGADKLIGEIEGVYKERFHNGAINPGHPDDTFESENVLEIVRYDASSIYIRAELQFYNGHTCGISGIARYDSGKFVYHEPPAYPDAGPCTLELSADGKQIRLGDANGSCRAIYCGARGSLDNYTIARSSKRSIRYMERLKASRQYKAAVDAVRRGGIQ